jgi:hypothetical protein
VQEPGQLVGRDIQGVTGGAGDHGAAGGCRDVVAQLSRLRLGLALPRDAGALPCRIGVARVPANGVRDGPVTGAAAQVALEVAGQVVLLFVGECCRGHQHAGGAETALEALPLQELLLDRVQLPA